MGKFTGIIPTRMGTRFFDEIQPENNGDHPHAYGDKLYVLSYWYRALGSSPRVWGQGLARYRASERIRIIPTRMGTSKALCTAYSVRRDHPHAYGDKDIELLHMSSSEGSSPRVWGQVIPL